MIALGMIVMSPPSMSIFAEYIGSAHTHQKGKIDFVRSINIQKKRLQEKLDDCAERCNFFGHPCELCNERGHLNLQCKLFHDRIMSKNCDDLISLAHHNELSLLLGYEELKRATKNITEFARYKLLDFDLETIYMFCAENCIENTYIANYLKERKQIEDDENTNEREETS